MEISLIEDSLILSKHSRNIKRITDILIAVPALLFISPLMLFIALLVRLDSPGSPLFVQVRVGRNGKYFNMFKIRTLYQQHFGLLTDQEEPHAYRITSIGKVLRRTKLDELPQLINIILGHMAIVGPRPDLPLHLSNYTRFQEDRFLVKPGLTGLAQVSGNSMLSWPNRIWIDIWYIKNWNLLIDLQIIVLTLTGIFKGQTLKTDPFNLHQQLPFKI